MFWLGFLNAEGDVGKDLLNEWFVFQDSHVLDKTKNASQKKTRAASRALLSKMCREAFESGLTREDFSAKPFKISYTDKGKPYFEGEDVYFSISHDGELCFVTLSDKNVGCDVQSMPYNKKVLEGAAQRFLNGRSDFTSFESACRTEAFDFPEHEVRFYKLRDSSIERMPDNSGIALLSFEDENLRCKGCNGEKESDECQDVFVIDERCQSHDEETLLNWCSFEARVKLLGCGMAQCLSVNENDSEKAFGNSLVKTFFLITKGRRYAVAVAADR